MVIKNEIETWFPNIVGQDFKIIPANDKYNCVSYTLNIFDDWLWTNEKSWPYEQIPRNAGIEGFKMLYRIHGFIDSDNREYEEGYIKVAFYSKGKTPTHAAKQYTNKWRSKLGGSVIIEHELEWLCGNTEWAYGDVAFIMKKEQ